MPPKRDKISTWETLRERVLSLASPCRLCPRECGARRLQGEEGFCRTGLRPLVSSVCLHRGEEPALSGEKGICNVFLAHCSLECRFCQNHQISNNRSTRSEWDISSGNLAEKVLPLLEQGEGNLGLVTPTHQLPALIELLIELGQRGKFPTVVYNSSGYERLEVLSLLAETVDVYLPDLKYSGEAAARAGSGTGDYPEHSREALKEMFRQKGPDLRLDRRGMARDGLIVRHLVLPGGTRDSIAVLRFLAEELSPGISLSLMSQYHPPASLHNDPRWGRTLTAGEYALVTTAAEQLGFRRGWQQALESPESYLPDFERDEPFA